MIAKVYVKSTVISARPNWLRSIDKGGNLIRSLSATYQLWGATDTALFSLVKKRASTFKLSLFPICQSVAKSVISF